MIKAYSVSISGHDIQTEIDLETVRKFPLTQQPYFNFGGAPADLPKTMGTLLNVFNCLNENGLRLQAIGVSRLLKRLALGRFDQSAKIVGLKAIPCVFDLGGGFQAVFVGEKFREIYLSVFGHPYQPDVFERIGFSELKSELHPSIDDCSFFIVSKGVDLFVRGHVLLHDFAKSFYTTGLSVKFISENSSQTNGALACALILLQYLYGLKGVRIFETERKHLHLWKALEKKRCLFMSSVFFQPVVNLEQTREEIFRGIRKSNKVDVNWGLKNLTFEYSHRESISRQLADLAYEFLFACHSQRDKIKRYGDHMPRPKFDTILKIVEEGHGIVSIARSKDGAIAGIVILVWQADRAYYQEAGFINDIDNKSPAYSILFDLMLKIKSMGLKQLHVNRLLQSTLECFDRKISRWEDWRWGNSHFKQAFSPEVETELMYNFESSTRPVTLSDDPIVPVFSC